MSEIVTKYLDKKTKIQTTDSCQYLIGNFITILILLPVINISTLIPLKPCI